MGGGAGPGVDQGAEQAVRSKLAELGKKVGRTGEEVETCKHEQEEITTYIYDYKVRQGKLRGKGVYCAAAGSRC